MALTILSALAVLGPYPVPPAPNDTYMAGQSGAPKNLADQTQVRMVTADIRMQVPAGKVKVTYVFTNAGPATNVTMAFPEEGQDAYLDDKTKTHFAYFRSTVDGKPVQTTPKKLSDAEDHEDFGYKIWWIKEVPFAKGQSRTVVNEYQSPNGSSALPIAFHQYIVETAKTWSGNLKSLRIEVDVAGLPAGTRYGFTLPKPRFQGQKALWYWENVKPAEVHNLTTYWAPPTSEWTAESWKEAFALPSYIR